MELRCKGFQFLPPLDQGNFGPNFKKYINKIDRIILLKRVRFPFRGPTFTDAFCKITFLNLEP